MMKRSQDSHQSETLHLPLEVLLLVDGVYEPNDCRYPAREVKENPSIRFANEIHHSSMGK